MFTIQNFNIDTDRNRDRKTGEQVYFEGSKKNELNDIKNYLRTIVSDPQKQSYRKELIKKIISFTTSGMDTSRLYPQIVLASATKDLVQKKLIYQYLSIYSNANQNFARMGINTFMKDCNSPNPNIRAFATRNLANLRFKGRQEYTYPILLNGLDDFSPLVKKSCVMGLTKLIVQKNRTLETPMRDQNILNRFYELLREADSSLVCTAIEAINQIQDQGIAMSKKLANYLLSNISNFEDLQLPVVLHYLQLYDPKGQQQIINILNILQAKMKSSSASVALAISKIYMKMAKLKPDVSIHIYQAIRSSLLSFLNHDTPQIQYVVLKHIEYLIQHCSLNIFVNDFKKFLLGAIQPTYIKAVKINILQLSINKANISDIVNEFAEYLTDEDICYYTIQAMTKILQKADQGEAKFIVKTLIKIIQTSPRPFLCDNSLPFIRHYLRVYPKEFALFANILHTLIENAKQDESRCAMVQIIGDFGQFIQEAVQFVAWNESQLSNNLKISLLRANVKLFLKRPDQMCNVLSNLFKKILTDDDTHLHVKDYAAYLYRGLAAGVQQFKAIFLDCRSEIHHNQKVKQQLQFNSLEIIYESKSQKWILDKLKYIQVQQQIQIEGNLQVEQPQAEEKQLIDIDVQAKFKKLQAENFDVTYSLSAAQFQHSWEQFDIGSSITRIVNNMELLSEQNLQQLFKIWNITVMASAQSEDEIKLYNYCKVIDSESQLGVACMQLCVHKLPQTMTLMIKSDNQQLAGFISRYIEQFLKLNEII